MTTTSPPGRAATDPSRSPSAGMEFRTPKPQEASEDVTQTSGSNNRSSPPGEATDASGEGKPRRGRRRTKSTRELVASMESVSAERDELVAKLTERRRELETECYPALGEALFSRRRDQDTAPLYDHIAASVGAQVRKKLAELALLPEELD